LQAYALESGNNELASAGQVDLGDIEVDFHGQPFGEVPKRSKYVELNFQEGSDQIAEIPFPHWSIYRQAVLRQAQTAGRAAKDPKQRNKLLSHLFRGVLATAVDKQLLFSWVA
jgi:hypothetical protein